MKPVLSVIALMLLLWTTSHADEGPRTVGVYKDHIKADREKGVSLDHTLHHMLYLTGIGDGFAVINKQRMDRGVRPLYCKPESTILDGGDYMRILETALARTDQPIGNHLPVAEAMLVALVAKFPCE